MGPRLGVRCSCPPLQMAYIPHGHGAKGRSSSYRHRRKVERRFTSAIAPQSQDLLKFSPPRSGYHQDRIVFPKRENVVAERPTHNGTHKVDEEIVNGEVT